MSTKACDIYSEQLLSAGFGHPLWIPESHKFAGGRELFFGDVGWLRDGQFNPLFNTMKTADDPINRDRVPRGFESVSSESQSKLLIGMSCMVAGSFQVTGSMSFRGILTLGSPPHRPADDAQCQTIAGLKFRCLGGPGSFMAIDSPAIAHDNLSNLWFFKCMQENMDSWLKFANTRLNHDLDEQDIVFVSRTIKTTRWAMGASPGEECSGDSEERCISEQPSSESPGDGGPRFSGRPFPVSHSGAGPTGASSEVLNQCLYIDYYKMKRRTSGEEQAPERASSRSSCDLKYEGESEDSSPRDSEPGYDPVGPLLDYILQNSDAAIAIASNRDVTDLLQGDLNTFPHSEHIPQAMRWLSPAIRVDKYGGMSLFKSVNSAR